VTTAIHWFRQDLRLADNPALFAATRAADAVIPVYLWSPEDEGSWPPGAASRWWLHESLQKLGAALENKRSRLVLRRGPTVAALLELAAETGSTQIFWNRRYEPAAQRIEKQLHEALRKAGVAAFDFKSALLSEPGEIKTRSAGPYQVFTPYWRAFLEQTEVGAAQPSPREIPQPSQWPQSRSLSEFELVPRLTWTQSLAAHWQPGETAARAALRRFVGSTLGNYAQSRDRPDMAGSSRLSPYLHHGELSPRQVWVAATRAGENSGKFCAELVWREFAAQQLHFFPALPDRPRNAQFERMGWRSDAGEFAAWSRGNTGFDIVDAGMRELWQTGWMHNRVRMIAASFLVKNLLHRWQDGERWFWDTLVDADLASNALNWQWVAGTSPDAAPWFRIFNPQTQAEKFDPLGTYRHRYVPETGTPGYSEPIVDLKQTRQRALDAYAALQVKT
jgi:deoxyribodipyrimidine photo-lyase